MVFCTVRELRNSPKMVWDALDAQKDVVITNNGKPRALMIDISADDLMAVTKMLRTARTTRAVMEIREEAVRNGTANMSMEEIDAEIAAYRAEKRAAKSSVA